MKHSKKNYSVQLRLTSSFILLSSLAILGLGYFFITRNCGACIVNMSFPLIVFLYAAFMSSFTIDKEACRKYEYQEDFAYIAPIDLIFMMGISAFMVGLVNIVKCLDGNCSLGSGYHLINCFTYEHIFLTSIALMAVNIILMYLVVSAGKIGLKLCIKLFS